MAKIYYVVQKNDDDCRASFFKSEKEALAYGISEFSDFEMGEDAIEDEENGGWYTGAELTFKKGFLFLMEEGDWSIQDMNDDDARSEVEGKENFGAIYFNGFKSGAYGYLGNGADGKNYSWSADDDGISENNKQIIKYNMKHVKLFEAFINEKKKWSDIDSYNIGDEFMDEFSSPKDWKNSYWSSLEDWMDQEWGPNAGVESSKGFEDALEEVTDYLRGEGYKV